MLSVHWEWHNNVQNLSMKSSRAGRKLYLTEPFAAILSFTLYIHLNYFQWAQGWLTAYDWYDNSGYLSSSTFLDLDIQSFQIAEYSCASLKYMEMTKLLFSVANMVLYLHLY